MTQNQNQSITPLVSPNLDYAPRLGLLDEAYSTDGTIKPDWTYLLESLRNLGPTVLDEREQKARRILRDDGASYNITEPGVGASTNWELDPVPYIIGSEDWAVIEGGLLERSELFNLILRDLYGPRTLLRHGALPPEAVFSHGGFLRACDGIQLPGEHEVILHAVDMVRQRNGEMCVLSDRTQAPAGIGYALENRTVMSRVFPSIYRDSHVHRLANFFQRLRLKLASLSPSDKPPHIALLTPGGRFESYFEHAFIANYLGLYLVQSGDLVVRNGFLWMKSLDGLTRVDVVFRYVDDAFCDPVELRSDSRLGVPGLLEVVRSGRVAVVNPLGAGVLENAIFLKYLPEISKCLLGREPRLDSVKTYWCGDDADLNYVQQNIRQLIIKPAFRGGTASVWGGDLSDEQINQLLATITQKRYHYVAQERLEKPHIPSYSLHTLEPRPALLRTFSVASENSYVVMPGGLTRIGTRTEAETISMVSGSPSKDTWITASEPERSPDTESSQDATNGATAAPVMSLPSRVVENLYWMGRYSERAEASLRYLRTVFVMHNGEEPISDSAQKILLETVTKLTGTQPGFINAAPQLLKTPNPELLLVITDGKRPGSIRSTLQAMLASADESKELLSTDTMRVINDMRDALAELDGVLATDLSSAPEEALDPLVTALVALSGLMQESMVRGVGWRFMELGKRVERSLQTITSIRALMTPVTSESDQAMLLNALLISMEVLITYRRRNRERRGIEMGLELVMRDTHNPRSLIFQIERLQEHLLEFPGADPHHGELPDEERALLEAITALKLSRMTTLLASTTVKREELESLLSQVEVLLKDFDRIISDKHFDHRAGPQQLVSTSWGDY